MKSNEALCMLAVVVIVGAFVSFVVFNFNHHTKEKPVTTYKNIDPTTVPIQGSAAIPTVVNGNVNSTPNQNTCSNGTGNGVQATIS